MQGGINLDLGNFQSIEIDAAANTMTVGGAARFKDITPKLQALGKEFRMLSLPGLLVLHSSSSSFFQVCVWESLC